MAKVVQRPKETLTTIQQSKKLSVPDTLTIGGLVLVAYVTKIVVPEIMQIPYVAVTALSGYLLFSPSGVPKKKNYQMILQLVLKDRQLYHSCQKGASHEI